MLARAMQLSLLEVATMPPGLTLHPATLLGSSSSSSAAQPASFVAGMPAASKTQWQPSLRPGAVYEEEGGSEGAVAGGSSCGSSRNPGSPRLFGSFHSEANDPELAAAIEASLRMSQLEEEQRRFPPEPAADEPGRVDLQIRTLDGRHLRRSFCGTDLLGQVYDYIDVSGSGVGDGDAVKAYHLVSATPRLQYEDRDQSLSAAGLQGECELIIELIEV